MEPSLRDFQRAYDQIFDYHGPRRYWEDTGPIDAAYALLQPADAVFEGKPVRHPGRGPGAVWGWFLKTPDGFFFGFERSKSWAARRLEKLVRAAEATR